MLSIKEAIAASPLHTTVLSSPTDIAGLNGAGAALFSGRDSSSSPAFFLASLSQKIWAPRVVVVSRPNGIAGIVYAKERRVLGFPTGVIFGDATFGSMIIAEPSDCEIVFRAGIHALLQQRHVQSLRLLVPPDGHELSTLLGLSARPFDVCQTPVDYHSVLGLPSGYEEFLETLGHRTRRNFRYYRQRCEAAHHSYAERIPLHEFQKIALSLLKEDVVGADLGGINRALRIFASVDRPLLVGLRQQNGDWLSVLGGWYESNRAVVFFQMNSDKRHARFSLSLVIRGYLIESLIEAGIKNLVFWAGVGDPLNRYVKSIPAVAVYVDARNLAWRMLRRSINSRRHWLPPLLGEWIGGPVDNPAALSQ